MGAAESAPSWHTDKGVYQIVRDFHDTYCRQPDIERECRRIHHNILNAIEVELRKEGICPPSSQTPGSSLLGTLHRFGYTGSTYDGVKVGRDGIEFDIMVILKGGNTFTTVEIPSKPGFFNLKPTNSGDNKFSTFTGSDGLISPDRVKRKFRGRLEKITKDVGRCEILRRYDVRLVEHGPATQMDVYDNVKKLYSVDMVPTFEIGDNQFVAKPFPGDPEGIDAWRISYSLKEKEHFDGLDQGNGCRKQVLRVCKVMRLDSAELKKITSYLLKNSLFFESEEMRDENDWRPDKLAVRVLGVWKRIGEYLDSGFMPSYFNNRMNLISYIPPMTRDNLKNRIKRFYTSQKEFEEMFKRIKSQYN